jgi:hypothetical protein
MGEGAVWGLWHEAVGSEQGKSKDGDSQPCKKSSHSK